MIFRYRCDSHSDCPSGDDESPTFCGSDPCKGKIVCPELDFRCIDPTVTSYFTKKILNLFNEWNAGLLLWPSCLSRLQIHVPMLWKCHWVQHPEQVSAYKIYNLIFLFINLISYFIRYYQTGVVSSHSSGDEGRGKDMAYLHSTVYTIIGQCR